MSHPGKKILCPGVRNGIIAVVIAIHVCAVFLLTYSWLKAPPKMDGKSAQKTDSVFQKDSGATRKVHVSLVKNVPQKTSGIVKKESVTDGPPELPQQKLEPIPQITEIDPIVKSVPVAKPEQKKTAKTQKPTARIQQKTPVKKRRFLTPDEISITRSPKPKKTNAHSGFSNQTTAQTTVNKRITDNGIQGMTYDQQTSYFAILQQFLKSRWINQPNVDLLGGTRPVVRVYFEVGGDGGILSRKIEPSGNRIMDSSVTAMVNALQRLPAPPSGERMRFHVDMRVE